MKANKNKQSGEKQPLNAYVKYSGLGFQMAGIIGAFAYVGYKLDQSQNTSMPIYTAILSLVGVAISLYFIFKGLK